MNGLEERQEALEELRGLTVYRLAREAECMDPDSDETAGAKFLYHVRDRVAELIEEHPGSTVDDLGDSITELADGAPDVYTYTRWLEFVDLGAWQEEIGEYGEPEDLTAAAGIALYMIAERLAVALIGQYSEDGEES